MNLHQLRGACFGAIAACALASLSGCDNPRAASAETAAGSTREAGDNFYFHANGDWVDSTNLPAGSSSQSLTAELYSATEKDIRSIVEELKASNPEPGSTAAAITALYDSFMDTDAVDARGMDPLKPHLDEIKAIASREDLVRAFGHMGLASPVSLTVDAHPTHTESTALWLGQSGLGLDHRNYYLALGMDAEATRRDYREYIAQMMSLLGYPDPKASAGRIFSLERKIATAHREDDPNKPVRDIYQPMDLAGLEAYAPGFDWPMFLEEAGFGGAKSFVISNGTAVRDCVKLTSQVPLEDWKEWLAFHLVHDYADLLPAEFQEPWYTFAGDNGLDVGEPSDDWRVAVEGLNTYMGEAVGALYVQKRFPPEHKAMVADMVANIRTAFAERLDTLDWMDDATRAEARAKLTAMEALIAYPEAPRDYTGLVLDKGKLFENVEAIYAFDSKRDIEDLSRNVDRARWNVPPQTVNAFYTPLSNQLVLPAAILQPPFFDPKADAADNYGGIGAVIGHEIIHGFDDTGRQMDEKGATRNWWTPETDKRFIAKAKKLREQYNSYCPLWDKCIDGRATLGENIADLAGLEIAYAAYKASLKGQEAPVIDGKTGDQRFFLAYAKQYREKSSRAYAEDELSGNTHSPSIYRVNGVVRNMDAWYTAFDVLPGEKLYLKPEDRIRIW
ncbi:MAG TPA: M13 family metallopeptidase [Hyphomonadaceae bacterium]|nr:M13 family metallopeptidase [Hyphomonadaceae bacterium]